MKQPKKTLGSVVSYKQKFVHRVLVYSLVSACPGKMWLGYLTIGVDWDTNHKHNNLIYNEKDKYKPDWLTT